MDIMTPGYLEMLCDKNKKQFEGILPLLIKKLIISSCKTVSSIRIPDRDDIWAPGFDGIIICDEISTYVPSGTSVWEFGTNTDSLTKINKDYEKRTNNPRGVNKADTCFRLVIPKVWAYNRTKTISEWEKEHSEWKETRVYDATMLCDWINREPAICAWLLEQFEEGLMIFSTVSHGVFIGYVNNIGVRTVTDGSDLKKIGMSFYDKATRYEIMFPHTKTVLQRIGDFYMADEKHELLLSELMD